jgi:hypothetical protein
VEDTLPADHLALHPEAASNQTLLLKSMKWKTKSHFRAAYDQSFCFSRYCCMLDVSARVRAG